MHEQHIINSKWISKVINDLDHMGLSFVWQTQGVGINKVWLKNNVDQLLYDHFFAKIVF